MNIPINKDLEEEYKNELIKGFSLREIVYVVISVLVVAGVSLIIWKIFEMPPDISVYIGLPFGIPTLLLGFKRFRVLHFLHM